MLLSAAALLLQLLVATSQDDARALRAARAAQRSFEFQRRARLPMDWNGGGGSRCDVIIGRFCYWYDSGDTTEKPEPKEIGGARAKLLVALDSAAVRSASGWIAGQRVRYLLEAQRLDDAIAAAGACTADPWWCAALRGLALHVAQRYAAADSAFASALKEMPAEQRCEWLDISDLLELRLAREVSRASCDDRATLDGRLFTISQPLWSIQGNDWRTEYFARQTMALILAQSSNAQGMSWGGDSRELLLRYGWSEWFTRSSAAGVYSSTTITGHDREPSLAVVPDVASLRVAPRLTPSSWHFREPRAASRYAPRSIVALDSLTTQLTRVPRGDSMLVVATYATSDSVLRRDSVVANIIALVGDSLVRGGSDVTYASIGVPRDMVTVSVELIGGKSKRAQRTRYTIDPIVRVRGAALSDLLLFEPGRMRGEDLDSALRAALAGLHVSARDPLGVFWTLDGVRPGPAWMSVTVEPARIGLGRRLATRMHLAREPAPVRLRWQDRIDAEHPGHVTLRLPEKARGTYRVTLTVQPVDAPALTSTREIQVLP